MKNSWLFVLVAAFVLVAGCAAPQAPAPVPQEPAAGETPAETPSDDGAMMESGSVEFVSVPSEVLIGKPIEVTWKVEGDGAVETVVLHGTRSSSASEPSMAAYQSFAPRAKLSGEAGEYSTSIIYGDPITVYVRAYAMVGENAVWSDERAVKIVTKLSSGAMMEDKGDAMEGDAMSDSGY